MHTALQEWDKLVTRVGAITKQVERHPVHGMLRSRDVVRLFMEHHVFAVWDFMCLLKALQRAYTSIEHPWVPRGHPVTRRLINEIVLGEESDSVDGTVESHFEMYVRAMEEVGANTSAVGTFVKKLSAE
jgi:hypothetical protein